MTAQSAVEAPRDSTLRQRLSTVREREFERAMRRLEASGDLSSAERQALEQFSRRLAARVLAEPAIATAAAAEHETDAASTLVELFEIRD